MEAEVASMDTVDAKSDAAHTRHESVEDSIQKLCKELAPVIAAHVRDAAFDDAVMIADDLGLRKPRTLTRKELLEFSESADASDISTSDLKSFRRAHLILKAADKDGETCYVAVEISFTANGRDTDRAIRNAAFMQRFAGKRSIAAVAGLYKDNRIDEALESGSVFWHQLDPEQLEVE